MDEENKAVKRFYRSRADRFIGGVCGGLGEYFNIDANLFRILFVVFTFIGGMGLILYVASLIIVPENPSQEVETKRSEKDKTVFWALLFIILGVALLFRQFGFYEYFRFWNIPWGTIWAFFLIGIGLLLIFSSNKNAKNSEEGQTDRFNLPDIKKLYRSRENRMLAGVCGGIAEYFNIDPSIVRLLWVLGSVASVGLGILVYVVLIFVFPEKSQNEEAI